jgi:hypothetical protein
MQDIPDFEVVAQIRQRLENKRRWHAAYGTIKPIISAEGNGIRVVAVGDNTLYQSKKWKTFPDFLFRYIWEVFGKEWLAEQKSRPPDQLHTLIHWYRSFKRLQRAQSEGKQGVVEYRPNGATAALVSLAYDLFTVENNLYLPTRLKERLRDAQQFQGARYELFCACALLRSGFSIEFQDESDGSNRHPEFVATHLATGIRIAVEAKSKHRPGVLAMPGDRIADERLRLGKVRQLLNDAVTKNVELPLVVFFDVNLPPDIADGFLLSSSSGKIVRLLESLEQTGDYYDLFSFVLFTNHPHHYGREDEPNPRKIYSGRIAPNPKHPLPDSRIINEIVSGAVKYGHIPQTFDSAP